jgi:hypothetical protein
MLLPRLPLKNQIIVQIHFKYCYLSLQSVQKDFSVRLACLIHAASVHPELGSNSTKKYTVIAFPALPQGGIAWKNFLPNMHRTKQKNIESSVSLILLTNSNLLDLSSDKCYPSKYR